VVVSVAETPGLDFGRHGRERRAQANRCRSVESGLGDVRTGGDPSSRISSGDALIRPERHPACRRREARPGFRMERENLCIVTPPATHGSGSARRCNSSGRLDDGGPSFIVRESTAMGGDPTFAEAAVNGEVERGYEIVPPVRASDLARTVYSAIGSALLGRFSSRLSPPYPPWSLLFPIK